MELIKKLFDKNTRLGRSVRTALQGLVAVVTFLYGLLIIPGLSNLLASNGIIDVVSFGVWVGVISYIHNALEAVWEAVR